MECFLVYGDNGFLAQTLSFKLFLWINLYFADNGTGCWYCYTSILFLVELVHVWHVQILYIIKGLPLRQSLACNKFKFYDFYLAA